MSRRADEPTCGVVPMRGAIGSPGHGQYRCIPFGLGLSIHRHRSVARQAVPARPRCGPVVGARRWRLPMSGSVRERPVAADRVARFGIGRTSLRLGRCGRSDPRTFDLGVEALLIEIDSSLHPFAHRLRLGAHALAANACGVGIFTFHRPGAFGARLIERSIGEQHATLRCALLVHPRGFARCHGLRHTGSRRRCGWWHCTAGGFLRMRADRHSQHPGDHQRAFRSCLHLVDPSIHGHLLRHLATPCGLPRNGGALDQVEGAGARCPN